ncbi:MlaA family lipoprotein [Pantoea sp. Mhis]|uniref:MlaA family lipoprotein n=1 Tax=Pantoea sp. Mhis TaxID=2576759 RepID=UPI001357394A|nr:MlaA family lipoprotein [Pantoea sp. Mhis]MXP56080.1 phospholipid-binding lipoprotein MlaA [Pantoea sp. Mhis]
MNNCLISLALVSTLLFGCTNLKQTNKVESMQRSDPLEAFNRKIFNFNYNILDPYILQPVAMCWRYYLPIRVRMGLNNFLNNLDEPANMVNAFLTGQSRRAMINFTRFFLNSTLGFAGIVDVALKANPELTHDDLHHFGSTLGQYGIEYGPYIEVPGYGSFTLREDGGDLIDMFYPILSFLTWPMSIGKWILKSVEIRAQLLDSDIILRHQQDPYNFVRNAYFQYHNFINNGGKLKINENANISAIENDLKDIDNVE